MPDSLHDDFADNAHERAMQCSVADYTAYNISENKFRQSMKTQ